MTPEYNLCDNCKTGKVYPENRVRFGDGWDDRGENRCEIVDLCPTCMASLINGRLSAQTYRAWKKGT